MSNVTLQVLSLHSYADGDQLSTDNKIWEYTPPAPACFLAGALFRLNSSAIKAMENLVAGIDVLEGETEPVHKIISTTFDEDKKQIVCLEPHCLGEGKPSTLHDPTPRV